MSAREEVLRRVRGALAGQQPGEAAVPRDYLRRHAETGLTSLFMARLSDYLATVTRVSPAAVPAAIAEACAQFGLAAIAVAPGFPASWLPGAPAAPGVRWLADEPPLGLRTLDRCSAALTTASVGIAVTGTIVLDAGPGQGRRALTLVPDVHVCVITAEQIASDVPDALARLDPLRPLTFISGPSATSDIELQRVEGVHGPRTLHVIVAEEERNEARTP